MQYWRCKCGEREVWESGFPPQSCQGCAKCGTTLAQHPDDHRPIEPHTFDPDTLRKANSAGYCKWCHERCKHEEWKPATIGTGIEQCVTCGMYRIFFDQPTGGE